MEEKSNNTWQHTLFSDYDIYLFKLGKHSMLYKKFGSHLLQLNGVSGAYFAVWAPNAKEVNVIGQFNDWNKKSHPLKPHDTSSGIWEGFIPGINKGDVYKYHILSNVNNYRVDKGDPYAVQWQAPPSTASIVWDLSYKWQDTKWEKSRIENNSLESPISIYEVHLGSWRRVNDQNNRSLTYRELAEQLPEYVADAGFSHVEILPIMEHPFYGSWGYQTIGYFAPTSRYGSAQDFMYLIDELHKKNIGVIFDWVPSHFPSDEHGPVYFDGTHLYEYADPKKGYHEDWKTYIFDYGKNEVRSFLISSALFWLELYHGDGLRVDAVASMLYLDYSRKDGEWIPNKYGGRENLEAIEFIKSLNVAAYAKHPYIQMIAEESTSWPLVSKPTDKGGLGFGMKWKMGWMHDTLLYFSKDPIYRKHYQDLLTFSMWYAYKENFVLPLSHDEVVYGKGSLLSKRSADKWQMLANLRLLLSYMYSHPGKKLLFMGAELAQDKEWNHESSLQWELLTDAMHDGVRKLVKDLNKLYRKEPALYRGDFNPEGYQWVDASDTSQSIIAFLRKSAGDLILIVCNATPVPRLNYRVGVPKKGFWKEILNSDSKYYGGSGYGNLGARETTPVPAHSMEYSLSLALPPLGAVYLKWVGGVR